MALGNHMKKADRNTSWLCFFGESYECFFKIPSNIAPPPPIILFSPSPLPPALRYLSPYREIRKTDPARLDYSCSQEIYKSWILIPQNTT